MKFVAHVNKVKSKRGTEAERKGKWGEGGAQGVNIGEENMESKWKSVKGGNATEVCAAQVDLFQQQGE